MSRLKLPIIGAGPSASYVASRLHNSAARYVAQHRNRTQSQASGNERKSQRPHVVLGTKPGDDSKWLSCDLYKVLVKPEDVAAATAAPSTDGETPPLPKYLGFGVGEKEKGMLFEQLPVLTAQSGRLDVRDTHDPDRLHETYVRIEEEEQHKASMLAKLMDLRNQNASGFNYHNRRQIILAFSEPENPYDTGRPEVQAAILTMRIRNLYAHLQRCKKDIGNRRSLRRLVHQRAKVLIYLKRLDRARYDVALSRLGLEPGSVEGELVL